MNNYNESLIQTKKNAFLQFMKNLQKNNTKKLLNINIYYFLLKNCFKTFLSNVLKSKDNYFKKLSLTFSYAINAKHALRKLILLKYKTKRINDIIENKNYFLHKKFYKNKLKKKILSLLKKFKDLKVHINSYKFILKRLYDKYLKKNLLSNFKKFHNSKFLYSKIKKFELKIILFQIKNYVNYQKQLDEVDRKIRKYKYKSKIKSVFSTISHKLKTKSSLRILKFKKNLFFQKLFIRKLLNQINRKDNLINKMKILVNNKFKFFVKKIKRKREYLIHMNTKINLLISVFNVFYLKLFFRNLKNIDSIINQIENENFSFYNKKLYFSILKSTVKINKKIIGLKNIYTNSQIVKINILKSKKCFFDNTKIKNKYNYNSKLAKLSYERRLINKTFYNLIDIFSYLCSQKQKYILSLLNFRKNSIMKIFSFLKIHTHLIKEKKSTYSELQKEREKIIVRNLLQLIITKSSSEIVQKENNITNLYIKRSTKGIKTALIWYKRLKNKISLKKINENKLPEQSEIQIEENKNKLINEKVNINKVSIGEDIEILLSLKTKKRHIPKKIEF